MRPALPIEWTDGTAGEWSSGPAEKAVPTIQDAAEILAKPIKLPPDVIEGVAHEGGKAVLGGSSKTRKTWLLVDMAVSVATGNLCLGRFATKKGRVLYVNFELPAAFFAFRLSKICFERQLTLEPGMFDILNLRGRVKEWAKLQLEIPLDHYSLIILDPSYKLLLGRDENSAGDIGTLMDEFDALAERTGAAILFGTHFPKGNQSQKESIDRMAGSGVYARDPDSILTFTAHEDDCEEKPCFSVQLTLRNHPPQKPFVVRWDFPLFVTDDILDPAKLKQTGRPTIHRAEDLLELIDKAMHAAEIVKVARDELGMERRRVFELLAELKRSGGLQQLEKRGKYERPKSA